MCFLFVGWLKLFARHRDLAGARDVADAEYTSFDRDGSPLRAELDITLIADNPVEKTIKIAGKGSPDLTHTRIVKSGDTLPQLTREIYGSPDYYLRVAQVNNLNDFRNLTPGQALVFPPLSSAQPEGSE